MFVLLFLPMFVDSIRTVLGVSFGTTMAVTLCLIIWLVRGFLGSWMAIQRTPVNWLVVFLAAAGFLSMTSPFGVGFVKAYRAASFCYSRLGLVVLVVNLVSTVSLLRRTMYATIFMALASAGIAILQFWLYETTGTNYSFAEGEQMFRETGAGTFLRSTALAVDANGIGIAMGVTAIWILYLALARRGLSATKLALHYLGFFVLLAGMLTTFSRSALLGFVLSLVLLCPVFAVAGRLHSWHRTAALLGVVAVVVISGISVGGMLFNEWDYDAQWRSELDVLGIRVMLHQPVTGVGLDAFPDYNNPYPYAVHNLFVQPAAEMGLPGALLFITLIGTVAVRLSLAIAQARDSEVRSMLLALFLGYVALIASYMSNPVLTSVFFWIYIGLIEAAVLIQRSKYQGLEPLGFSWSELRST
jgi:O-antigen ligase